ncbi:unnamed protein product [Meganyctiphanes norvegica]|uniref:Endonuclease/exonuclease/phosphatase domain-containing protein n=1 Tax=Meganyctiphanes norvegica TaxID=48144 RepID=A0AAV2QTL6_MEGNR
MNTESVSCKIHFGPRSLLFACFYRPPNSSPQYNLNINTAINNLTQIDTDQCLICGDFNYPKIDWPNHLVLANDDSFEQLFYDECQNSFLQQHVSEFTRQRGEDDPSVLDLVFSKNEFEIEEIRYESPIGKSDHSVLAFNFKLEGDLILDEVELTKKKFFQADYTQINDNFKLNNWSVAMLERDLQDKWDFLLHSYINIIDELVPVGPLLGGGQFLVSG